MRTGGRILIDQLALQASELVFGVPGESFLHALDAFLDVERPRFITCRQEGGAAMMAEAHGKLTGRPGIALVTRGPGATNASAGVHIARQDSTPMILLIGQVGRGMRGREAFQEIDLVQMFTPIAKWAGEVEEAARLPEFIHRAFSTAMTGRPGPVVLVLPEDVLAERADVADAPFVQPAKAAPERSRLRRLEDMLKNAQRPLVIIGGGGWSKRAREAIATFARANRLPVAAAFRRQDYIDNTHPCYVGDLGIAPNPRLARRARASDLLIILGPRLGEMTTGGYRLFERARSLRDDQLIIHVHNSPEELGRIYEPDLAILADLTETAEALAALPPVDEPLWAARTGEARDQYLRFMQPPSIPGELQMGEIMVMIRDRLPDAIVTNGAGNYAAWTNKFFCHREWRTQLAPTSGSMGYGLPAAIAAKLDSPGRPVLAFAGDGCFQMTLQELATAVDHALEVIVLVIDNGSYGTIRMHQERAFPRRVSGTSLRNPDFVALARAYGAFAQRIERTDEFAPALEEALEQRARPSLLHLLLDPEAITPMTTISAIRQASSGGQRP